MNRIIEKGQKEYDLGDLVQLLKKNPYIDECGAIFTFEGIMRSKERGKTVSKLTISIPSTDMAEAELERISREVQRKYGVRQIVVVHYIGEFSPGDTLFQAAVAGPHRQETRDALKELIERVKYELDFKKEEETDSGINIIMSGG